MSASAPSQIVSARVSSAPVSDIDRVRMELMERMSTVLVCVMGIVTILMIHTERLRREIRILRAEIPLLR